MLVLDRIASAGANPLHTTRSRCIRRELEGLSVDDGVSIATVLDVDDAVGNRYVINVFALDVGTSRQTGLIIITRHCATVLEVLGDSSLGATGQVQTF